MPFPRPLRTALLVLATAVASDVAAAQEATVYDVSVRANASRTELAALVDSLQRQIAASGSGSRRRALEQDLDIQLRRLASGDLRPGDRILLRIRPELPTQEAATIKEDTTLVTPQLTVEIPGLPPISMRGVLFADVDAHLRREVRAVIRNVRVTAVPLVSIGVLGSVTRPGYFLVPVSASVTEALMVAGGPLADADPNGLVLQRGGQEHWNRAIMTAASQRQVSLISLGVHDGDVLVVKRVAAPIDRTSTLSILSFVLQGVLILTQLRN